MDPSVRQVIDRVEKQDAADREERAAGVVHPPEEGLWALHPDTARLIHIIVQSAGYKKLLEVGVSHGYSTLWLANAARATGGRLTALEDNPASVEIAQQNLEAAGLSGVVDFVLGDARGTLQEIENPVDFVLFDCWDRLYPEILPHVLPVLRPGGLLVTDNVTPGNASSDSPPGQRHGDSQCTHRSQRRSQREESWRCDTGVICALPAGGRCWIYQRHRHRYPRVSPSPPLCCLRRHFWP